MKIKEIHVKNFRSILDATLTFDDLTILVGQNGAGKSSFFKALELFYGEYNASVEDFFAENSDENIEITVVYTNLNREAKNSFSKYLEGDEFRVVRVLSNSNGEITGKYHGKKSQNPDFFDIRKENKEIRKKFNELIKENQEKYESVNTANSAKEAHEIMEKWENDNPDSCKQILDDGQFLGFKNVGKGSIGKFSKFFMIPAVQDAQDEAADEKKSSIKLLIDLVIRSKISNRDDVRKFDEEIKTSIDEIYSRLKELETLKQRLSKNLRQFVPDADIDMEWTDPKNISFPTPEAYIKLIEDGYITEVERTGHGLQRAFIFSLLRLLGIEQSIDRTSEEAMEEDEAYNSRDDIMFDLILAIEEPEIYQHPSRQRHFSSVMQDLVSNPDFDYSRNTQILFTTHSPLFVDLDRFDQIRLIKKTTSDNSAMQTKIYLASMEKVIKILNNAKNTDKFDEEKLKDRLCNIMTPWVNEGFFANKAVLVEGPSDRAAILTSAKLNGHNFDAKSIVVIPCESKSSLDKPYAIFSSLGIPVYVIWDWDNNANSKENEYLMNIIGLKNENNAEFIHDVGACFETNLEDTIREGLSFELYDKLLNEERKNYGLSRQKARKRPIVIQKILERAAEMDITCEPLDKIVKKIMKL